MDKGSMIDDFIVFQCLDYHDIEFIGRTLDLPHAELGFNGRTYVGIVWLGEDRPETDQIAEQAKEKKISLLFDADEEGG